MPLGAFLSGGRRLDRGGRRDGRARRRGPVKTFSIGFDDEQLRRAAATRALVAERFGTEHHELRRASPDAVELLPRLVRHYGEPFADSSAIPSFYLAEMARRHVTVALNGDGGDESFAGYERYVANAALPRASTACPRRLRRGARAPLAARRPRAATIDAAGRSRLRRRRRPLRARRRRSATSPAMVVLRRPRRDAALHRRVPRARSRRRAPPTSIDARGARRRRPTPCSTGCSTSTCRPTCPATCWSKMDIATMASLARGALAAARPRADGVRGGAAGRAQGRGREKKIVLRGALRGVAAGRDPRPPKMGFACRWATGCAASCAAARARSCSTGAPSSAATSARRRPRAARPPRRRRRGPLAAALDAAHVRALAPGVRRCRGGARARPPARARIRSAERATS